MSLTPEIVQSTINLPECLIHLEKEAMLAGDDLRAIRSGEKLALSEFSCNLGEHIADWTNEFAYYKRDTTRIFNATQTVRILYTTLLVGAADKPELRENEEYIEGTHAAIQIARYIANPDKFKCSDNLLAELKNSAFEAIDMLRTNICKSHDTNEYPTEKREQDSRNIETMFLDLQVAIESAPRFYAEIKAESGRGAA
ncbi:MAG: hypothetical protein COV36_07895 [Alphaproteobacteria bacterium CG11_big_fil_rev_8_21_14_0_20_44_7]|nr:MAG: hypothetical protein COV36_07895 [Alphaproteobacteria bacterium CG11_big_fil_rev_8_21_14_0_20_44_7]